ncbi:unnamed protein product [Lactuca virosa]|uniref:Uncharacterized protein n=1 Tax=Lactuca virosa TaxID=75947 RepID=A0AAU9NEB9_9ASTR|nr:unnamed protein product [Lactuca virosa]
MRNTTKDEKLGEKLTPVDKKVDDAIDEAIVCGGSLTLDETAAAACVSNFVIRYETRSRRCSRVDASYTITVAV